MTSPSVRDVLQLRLDMAMAKITEHALATQLGITLSYVSHLLNGDRDPPGWFAKLRSLVPRSNYSVTDWNAQWFLHTLPHTRRAALLLQTVLLLHALPSAPPQPHPVTPTPTPAPTRHTCDITLGPSHPATGWLTTPSGRHCRRLCRRHAALALLHAHAHTAPWSFCTRHPHAARRSRCSRLVQ